MYEGKLIEHIEQGKFICTLCLQDKGNKLHLLTSSNRELNLSTKRAFLVSEQTLNTAKPREELLQDLREAEKTRERLRDQVDVKELWELITDETEHFDHRYLAQLVFGEAISDGHLSAVVRALFEDRVYFRLKDGRFLANSEAKVEQITRQREEEARKEEKLGEGSLWLREALQDKSTPAPACREEIVSLLKQLALQGDDAPDFKYGKQLLERAGITDIRQAHKLLIKLGEWEEDENLELLRMDVPDSFSRGQIEAAEQLPANDFRREGREDLTHLPVMTVDGPLTRDYDDALSIQPVGDDLQVGIHIADVAAMIPPRGLLDAEAAQRGSSLYLPRRQIPMLPPSLSQDTLSLKESRDRPAVSLLVRLDRFGNILEYRFVPSLIIVSRQLTYDAVNEALKDDHLLTALDDLSRRLRMKRKDRGALSLSLPELEIEVDAGGTPRFELVEQNTPSRRIVAEFMILYNWLAASFCRENRIPILFRTQAEPEERLSFEEGQYLYYVFQQRRKLSPLKIDVRPDGHSGLGLDVYTQATSPIRRYLDLVAQRQIAGFLLSEGPLYTEKELEEIRMAVEPVVRNLAKIKRNRQRYWVLKYLRPRRGMTFSARVLYELKTKYRLVVPDFLLIAEVKRPNGLLLRPGQEILVELRKADPWNDVLELAFVKEIAKEE